MIDASVVDQINELLRSGNFSLRGIARQTGVSRGTVSAIARGKRPDETSRSNPAGVRIVLPDGPPRRCPHCGALVQMPCLACLLRAIQRARRMRG